MKNRILEEIRKNGLCIADDVYQYGMFILIHYLIFTIISFVLCLKLGCIKEMAIFLISFYFIRKYVGGFHFNNSRICTIFTVLFITLFSFLASEIQISLFFYIVIVFLIIIMIDKIGCIEHKNKKLSKKEKIAYKRKAIRIIIIYLIIGFATRLFRIFIVVNVLGSMLIFMIINILIGVFVNKRKDNSEVNDNENSNF